MTREEVLYCKNGKLPTCKNKGYTNSCVTKLMSHT